MAKAKKVARKSSKSKKAAEAPAERKGIIGYVRGLIRKDPEIETVDVRKHLLAKFGSKGKGLKTLDAKANPTGVSVLVARARNQLLKLGDVKKEDLPTANRPLGHLQMKIIPNAKELAKVVGTRAVAGGKPSQKPKKGKGKKAKPARKAKKVKKVARKAKHKK